MKSEWGKRLVHGFTVTGSRGVCNVKLHKRKHAVQDGIYYEYKPPIAIQGIASLYDSSMILCVLAISRNQNSLLLEQLGQRTILMHRHHDIGAANKLLVNVELWNGGPLGVFLDSYTYG